MKKLYNIFETLILENITPDVISDTINNKKMAKIIYTGNNSTGSRTIVPFLYGMHKSGDMMIRAWQLGGDTDTANYKWKTFKVGEIKSWDVSNGSAKSVLTALFNSSTIPDYVGKADKDFITVMDYIPVSDYMSSIGDKPEQVNQFEPNSDKADGGETKMQTQREPIKVSNDDVANDTTITQSTPTELEPTEVELEPELEDEFLTDEEDIDNDDIESDEDSDEMTN